MSGLPDDDAEIPAGAEAIWAHAADWLAERTSGDWTECKQTELDAWLAESSGHLLAYWRVEAAWERTHRLAALRHPADQRLRKQVAQLPRSVRPMIVKIAAVIVTVSALTGLATVYSSKPVERTFATVTGGREIVSLADGSTIELNTDTRLRLIQGKAGRQARLEKGEAFFQIKHDAAHPFIVIAGDHLVTDLGTKFVLRRDRDELKVSMLEGSARVDGIGSANNSASATLTPGDVAVATVDTLVIAKRPERQLKNDLSWRRGLLVFSNTPLNDVVAELNRYNAVKLTVADPKTAKIEIGGTFPANDTGAFVRVARELLGLHVASRGGELVISR